MATPVPSQHGYRKSLCDRIWRNGKMLDTIWGSVICFMAQNVIMLPINCGVKWITYTAPQHSGLSVRLVINGSRVQFSPNALSSSASHTRTSIPRQYKFSYWYKLGGKQAHHATYWIRFHGSAALAGIWLRADVSDISAATGLRKTTCFFTLNRQPVCRTYVQCVCVCWQKCILRYFSCTRAAQLGERHAEFLRACRCWWLWGCTSARRSSASEHTAPLQRR